MDGESVASAEHHQVKPGVYILEPGVTIIKPQQRWQTLVSILIRLSLGSLILAAGVGAVVYSVIHSEELAASEDPLGLHHVHKDYFKFFHDQSCSNGTLTIERQLFGEYGSHKKVTNTSVSWIQDHTHERIVHRVGVEAEKWEYTFFVYHNYSVLATKTGCQRKDGLGYNAFLKGFGLFALPKVRMEKIVLEPRTRPVNVELYQGEPNSTGIAYGSWHSNSSVPAPYLATAFTQPDQGLVYGWQAYFEATPQSDIHWMEFWFPHMNHSIPDAAVFFDYPLHCLNSTSDHT
ncbi:hypothetical protein Ddc_05178 [Ditylenchus destructor]|nr:hypothetical protein Ddc_05178 [Ditylenchus destructor]